MRKILLGVLILVLLIIPFGSNAGAVDDSGSCAMFIAAYDATELSKSKADIICSGTADEIVIAAAFSCLENGGTVTLSEGHFYITWLSIENDISLVGSGNSTVLVSENDHAIMTYGKHGFTLSDFVLDGNDKPGFGMFFESCHDFLVENVEIYDTGESCARTNDSYKYIFDNVYLHDTPTWKYGFSAYGNTHDVWFINSLVEDVGAGGIFFSGESSVVYNIFIENNLMMNCRMSGIWVTNTNSTQKNYNVHIDNNTSIGSLNNDGILFQNTRDSIISNNICKFNGGDGLAIGECFNTCDHVIVSNNILTGNQGRGIWDNYEENQYMIYEGNILTDNGMGNVITITNGVIVSNNLGFQY